MDSPKNVRASISHASDDKERFVRRFAEKLVAKGVEVWFDEWEINPGDNPVRKIFEEGLPNCEVIILVMSANTAKKPWVKEELDAAFVRKVEGVSKLIPLRLDGCEMPECLKDNKVGDHHRCYELRSRVPKGSAWYLRPLPQAAAG